ncbi:MAG: hypothetical protein MPJ50_15645, partial [Pirellulales bacterium]|nr:hypothetical protein [Pirellulales bacterium]
MGDLLGILCVLTLVLCLITFLGHGIWVVLASLFAPSAKETSVQAAGIQSRPPRPRCHVCGLLPENDDQACRRCGTRLLTIPQAANARDALASVEDQLRRLWNLGQVDQDAYERVFGILRAEQQRLELDQSPAAPTEQHDVGARVPPLPAQRNAEARHATTTKPQLPLPFGETAGVTVQPPEPSMDMVSLAISGAVETDQAEPATIKNSTQDDVARVPVAPRKTWGEVFASFMEERHLRWGELVGGLMIVCGSIALVLSFWGQIAQRPFLKFFVFNGVTAGLFGLGFYTDRRMKLPNTGQAVLMIASLLVPLNFLALAAFSRDAVDLNVVTLAGEAVSIIVFCTLLRTAGPTIASRTPWGFAIGVLVPSIGTLLVRRFIDPASGEPMLVMVSVLLLAFYVGTTAWLHWRSRMESEFSEQLANEHFRLLGMATFAAILPLGLLAFRAGNVAEALRVLSPLAAIVAAPPLAVGLRIWQGTKVPGLAGVRTAACAVAIAGAGILLLGIAIGWPHPASLVPAAIVAAVCLSVLGATYRIPAAQVLVAVAVTISGVIIFHVTNGTIAWRSADAFVLLDVLVGGETGWALAGVALGLLLLAGAWSAARFQRDAIVLTRSAFTVACLSLIFVTGHGWGRPGDPLGVVWFLSAAGLVLLTGAVILRPGTAPNSELEQELVQPDIQCPSGDSLLKRIVAKCFPWKIRPSWLAGLATVLFGGSIAQAVVFLPDGESWRISPWIVAFLTHASSMGCLALIVSYGSRQ